MSEVQGRRGWFSGCALERRIRLVPELRLGTEPGQKVMTAPVLFPYQREALDAVRAARARGVRSCAVVLPTGTGKTFTFANQISEHLAEHGGRAIVIVHNDHLYDQTLKELAKAAPHLSVGAVKGTTHEVEAQVIVASRPSLGAASARGLARRQSIQDVGLIVVDECDLAAAPQYLRIIEHYPDAFVTGYTATFMRADGKALGKIFSEIVFERDTLWAVENRFLIEPIGKRIEIPDLHLVNRRGDWSDEQVGDALAESLAPGLVVDAWLEHASDRKTIAFVPTVKTGYLFAEEFQARGVHAEVIHGGTPKDEQAAMHARHKPGTVLISCMLLAVGYDQPDITAVLMIRFTKNRRLYIQMAGRGLRVDRSRPYEGQNCLIMNVTGQDVPSLVGVSVLGLEDPEEKADRKAKLDLTGLLDPGAGVEEDPEPFYDGVVEVVDFDPLCRTSEHVWLTTAGGVRFLPSSADTFIFLYPRPDDRFTVAWCSRTGKVSTKVAYGPGGWSAYVDLPLGEAMRAAERYVRELVGQARASKRSVRYQGMNAYRPSYSQRFRAEEMGVVIPDGITGPEMSDLLDTVQGTRRIDRLVDLFKEAGK